MAFQTYNRFAARGPVTQFLLQEMAVFLVRLLTLRQQKTVPLILLLALKRSFFSLMFSSDGIVGLRTYKEIPSNIQAMVAACGELSWCSTSEVRISCGSREVCFATSCVPTVGKDLKLN